MIRSRSALCLLALSACTDAGLTLLPADPPTPVDDKLAIEGSLCTLPVEDLVYPLRVVVLVDASESMSVTDPPDPITGVTSRERAVKALADELLDGTSDTRISVVRFSAEAQPLTQVNAPDGTLQSYFTDDPALIASRLYLLGETDRKTNFVFALSEAYAELRHELTQTSQEDLGLSNVQVILVTDGIPDQEGSGDPVNDIRDAVKAIVDLGSLFRLDTIGVSTAHLASGVPAVDNRAETLLQELANIGKGTFRSFASGGELNFLYVDLSSLKRVFTLDSLVAWNLNALVQGDEVRSDSDGDGLSDAEERALGTSPYLPDSDGDGCRDSLEVRNGGSGLDPLNPDDCKCYLPDYCFDEDEDGLCDSGCLDVNQDHLCDCPDLDGDGLCDPDTYQDTDGDGLFDCEERWAGTNSRGADTDGDGLLDLHELRFGTSPDIDDFASDLDWDVVSNGDEVRTATDPHHVSARGRYHQAYRYALSEQAPEPGRSCYDFGVSNITLTEALPALSASPARGPLGQGWSGHDRVLLFAGEVPFDSPGSYARYRVACVEAGFRAEGNYRDPPSGRVTITEDDFVDLLNFEPARDCVLASRRSAP